MADRQPPEKRMPERELVCHDATHAWWCRFGVLKRQSLHNLKQWLTAS